MKCIHGAPIATVVEQLAGAERGEKIDCLQCNPHGCASVWCVTNVRGHECRPEDLRSNEAYLRMAAHEAACAACRGCPTCKGEWEAGRCAEGKRLLESWRETL